MLYSVLMTSFYGSSCDSSGKRSTYKRIKAKEGKKKIGQKIVVQHKRRPEIAVSNCRIKAEKKKQKRLQKNKK